MNIPDLFTMLANLTHSLQPVEHLITGFSYLAGIVLVMSGLMRMKKVSGSNSHESIWKSGGLIFAGAGLLFLPSTLHVVSNTLFGTSNILQYSKQNSGNIFATITMLLQFAGLIWFIRGSIMLIHAGQPGEEHGVRGLLFIVAGITAINFSLTMGWLSALMGSLVNLSLTVKSVAGF